MSGDAPLTILVVEDEFWIRLWISDFLRRCGHYVVEAPTGDEALEVLTSGGFEFDVVFSDVQMPGSTSGFDLAQWLRKHQPAVTVLLTSGAVRSVEIASDLCEQGAILHKPYEPAQVLDRIRRATAQRGPKPEPDAEALG